mmetsp:Transcript_4626/g.10652  ORF Transcript_4626/g.10652 Transcript_4626/m.10652 type:complete len:138 (+) Transcript_4626:94-507(+)
MPSAGDCWAKLLCRMPPGTRRSPQMFRWKDGDHQRTHGTQRIRKLQRGLTPLSIVHDVCGNKKMIVFNSIFLISRNTQNKANPAAVVFVASASIFWECAPPEHNHNCEVPELDVSVKLVVRTASVFVEIQVTAIGLL